jgi:ferredoxin-NADP reductase
MLFVAPDRLQASQVVENQLEDTQYYLSGSERFVEGLRADLTALSVPHEQIVFDYYDGYVEL